MKGIRFRKSIKIAPGIKLNIGKGSIGLSAGVRGASISTNTRTGSRASVGIPGTGVRYEQRLTKTRRSATSPHTSPSRGTSGWMWISIGIIFLVVLFNTFRP